MASIQRPDVRVIVRILGVLCERSDRLRPTQLQQASRTNYTQFARYLAFMSERGFVRSVEDGAGDRWVVLTPRGFEAHRFLIRGLQAILVERPRPSNEPPGALRLDPTSVD